MNLKKRKLWYLPTYILIIYFQGEITVQSALDRETISEYTLTVEASDNIRAPPYLRRRSTVKVLYEYIFIFFESKPHSQNIFK